MSKTPYQYHLFRFKTVKSHAGRGGVPEVVRKKLFKLVCEQSYTLKAAAAEVGVSKSTASQIYWIERARRSAGLCAA